MVHKLIELSLRNRLIVLVLAAALFVWGIFSINKNPIDAIPDLSENQPSDQMVQVLVMFSGTLSMQRKWT